VTPPATTASLPRCRHWPSASLPLRESVPVPALLVSQVLCCVRCPLDPVTWRTTLGTSLVGCKAQKAPALPYQHSGCGVGPELILWPHFVPTPPSHRRCAYDYRVSWVRQISLTIAASVTWASWQYGSASPLARVPTKLGLMPTTRGYPGSFGWVRTSLPYQRWHASRALRHGLAPRPAGSP
jgi:hypothetical protein